jgi:hypothetical protein
VQQCHPRVEPGGKPFHLPIERPAALGKVDWKENMVELHDWRSLLRAARTPQGPHTMLCNRFAKYAPIFSNKLQVAKCSDVLALMR